MKKIFLVFIFSLFNSQIHCAIQAINNNIKDQDVYSVSTWFGCQPTYTDIKATKSANKNDLGKLRCVLNSITIYKLEDKEKVIKGDHVTPLASFDKVKSQECEFVNIYRIPYGVQNKTIITCGKKRHHNLKDIASKNDLQKSLNNYELLYGGITEFDLLNLFDEGILPIKN